MTDPRDLRGFRWRVRLRHGEDEVELETGRTTSHPTLEALLEQAQEALERLRKAVDSDPSGS